jgi:hypothetical protein
VDRLEVIGMKGHGVWPYFNAEKNLTAFIALAVIGAVKSAHHLRSAAERARPVCLVRSESRQLDSMKVPTWAR